MRRTILSFAALLLVSGAMFAGSILGYEPSIDAEEGYASDAGHTVTLWDDATWQSATASDFAAFDAILIGQSGCGDLDVPDGIFANSNLWGPLVTGNILIHSHDDHFGTDAPSGSSADNRYDLVIADCADWTTSGDGLGLCLSIQCASFASNAEGGRGGTANLDLPGIGSFVIDDSSGDDIDIVNPAHPAMAGLTDADLDCWGSSVHTHIPSYPADFEVLATDTGLGCEEIGETDGRGEDGSGPVTIARGDASGSILAIPALSPTGLVSLALLLAAGAVVLLRRQ